MFKIFLLILSVATNQPVGITIYPPQLGTPDAEFATEAECKTHLSEAMAATQAFVTKQSGGKLVVAAAVCRVPPKPGISI